MLCQLSYSRSDRGGEGWIRTTEGIRQQIYSLPPLTAREPRHNLFKHPRLSAILPWSWRWDLNPQPADYKSAALPVELRQHRTAIILPAHITVKALGEDSPVTF